MRDIYPGKHIDQWPVQSSCVRGIGWWKQCRWQVACQSFLAWTLCINVICKRPVKAVLQIREIKDAKKEKKKDERSLRRNYILPNRYSPLIMPLSLTHPLVPFLISLRSDRISIGTLGLTYLV